MRIFGLDVDNKTDVLALTAFTISIVTAMYQVGIFFIGPNARTLEPDGMTLLIYQPSADAAYLSVLAPITVANSSNSPEPLLLIRATSKLSLNDNKIHFEWHEKVGRLDRNTGALVLEDLSTVTPILIDTKRIMSSFILFTPQSRECPLEMERQECNRRNGFISKRDTITMSEKQFSRGDLQLSAEFSLLYENDTPSCVRCVIDYGPSELNRLEELGYVSRLCSVKTSDRKCVATN